MTEPQNQQDNSTPENQTTEDILQSNPLAQKIIELENSLKEAQQTADERTQAAQRALADLQNFKRRTEEERSRFAQMAAAHMAKAILPALQNFELAFKHSPESEDGKKWAESIQNIHQQLTKDLGNQGLTKIETVGQKLDPQIHEALLQGPGEENVIIEELEPGYKLGEHVIKPARVKVGNGS